MHRTWVYERTGLDANSLIRPQQMQMHFFLIVCFDSPEMVEISDLRMGLDIIGPE